MNNSAKNIAVIGAGPMGLMTCYELLKQGHQVTLYEADDRIGGMSASFDLAGTKIERFYHFICSTDYPLFNLLDELELSNKLTWQNTKMGFYCDGTLYPWGDPISLLKFPKLSLISKFRYGLHVFYTKYISDWSKLDNKNANTWLKKWVGKKAYDVLWDSLFRLKFFEYENDLSAAWIGTRIKRVARSRKSIFQEQLGYLSGGSDTLLDCLADKITAMGGKIVLNAQVEKICTTENQVNAVAVNGQQIKCDVAISTIPLPFVPLMAPDLPEHTREQISAIPNVGVACVLLKLKQPLSPYFWMNINDKNMEVPGIIEYTNLNPKDEKVIYIPYYMPQTHHKYKWHDDQFIAEVSQYLTTINPNFSKDWILASHVARYNYAQTICSPGFYSKLPAMKSAIDGFYMADTSFYYPEDRSISESIAVGKKLAETVLHDQT